MGKHSDFHLSFFQIAGARRDFTVVTKLMKNFKSLYGFGGRCLKIRDVNLVPRSLVDEAEGEIWQSKKICFS